MTPLSCGPVAFALKRKLYAAAGLVLLAACASAPVRSNPGAERAVAADLDHIFGASLTDHALWGVEVKSLDTGRIWYARNARTLMMPASNMKIVTLAAAVRTLGWDHRFKTSIEAIGPIEDGTLRGNLFVRGSGDPSLNTRNNRGAAFIDDVAAALKSAGITSITGAVVADDDAFDDTGLGQGWSWDYLQDDYAAPSGALEFNENIAKLVLTPGSPGDAASVTLSPGAGYQLANHATTGEAGSTTRIDIGRRASEAVLDITGSIPSGASPVSRDVAVVNPTVYFAQSLRNGLVERGIGVNGGGVDLDDVRTAIEPGTRRVLFEAQSPPLSEIATVMMKVSQNLYAETLLKAVGAATSGSGTAEAGRDAAREIFAGWNVPGTYVQADGSGLSRYDYVTAEMLVAILEHFHADQAFIATLPIAGKDGTVSTRMRATRAEANAVAKTGSISNVRALSGYVKTRDGETLAFSVLANNFTVPAATINWMTDLAVETLANYTMK